MIKTAKTSIKAIIFVSIYFLFIIFISLFKGIYIYNIKIPNLKINRLFLRINNKLILKANGINIISSKTYNKTAFNLHKEFFLISKILPFFQEIDLNNLKFNKYLIAKKISLKNNKIYVFSNDIYAIGTFYTKLNNTYTKLKKIQYKQYTFNNVAVNTYYNKKYVFINIKLKYKKSIIYLALKATNSIVYHSLYFKKLNLSYNNYKLNLQNCTGKGKFYINNNKFTDNLKCDSIVLYNNIFHIISADNIINIDNKNIYAFAKKGHIKFNRYNINLDEYNLFYSFNNKYIMLQSKKDNFKYQKYLLNSKKLSINYNLENKNLFLHTINIKLKNDISMISKELTIYKRKNYIYYSSNNNIKGKYFNLNTKSIKGNEKKILISNIIGKILKFDTYVFSPQINIKEKKAKSKKIILNNIVLNNNLFSFSKDFVFSTHTSVLFDKNLKEILNYFHISIPVTQHSGTNELNITLKADKTNIKKFNINYSLNSLKSIFIINNIPTPVFYNNLKIKGDLNKSDISIDNFTFPYKYLNIKADGNISVNIPKKYINSFLYIKKLNIYKYLNIKNFHEKIAINLVKNYLFLLNSSIFINLNNQTIYFYNLKNILHYSVFNEIFNNGEAIIKIVNNRLDIFVNAFLNYPVILNQKNTKHIKGEISINKNNIKINTQYGNVEIKNLENLMAYAKNIDISIPGLINTIDSINKLISRISSNKDSHFNAVIQAKNTNFLYKNHKFIANTATFQYNKEINFSAKYNKSILKGYTKNNYLLIQGKHYRKKELIPLLNFFNNFRKIDLDFLLVKSPDNFYTGKIYVNSATVKNLKLLNNIIAFVNTLPALITLHSPGFSAKGYKIKNSFIDYLFYKKIIYFKQIKIIGTNINFSGKGFINLNKNLIKLKLNLAIKFKFKKIPVIGKAISYLFFGKDGYLHINILVHGNIDNPKVDKDLGVGLETPFNLFKRVLTLPFNLF